MVRLFDRYAKLRPRFRTGRIVVEPKEMLPLLKGHLSKDDLPAAIVEPGDLDELRATLEFVTEKQLKIAVGAGLAPTLINGLNNLLLVLTSRLSQSPVISTVRRTARVSGGFPLESLAIDFAREGLDWWPLYPVPSGKSVGALIAGGWEGIRSFKRGGTLCHINFVEWMGYDGKSYASGPSIATLNAPDVSGSLFGSRGKLGIITGAELTLHPALKKRSAALLEFVSAAEAVQFFAEVATYNPQPESVVFWGGAAVEIIRQGNDGTISDACQFAILVEWDDESMALPSPWDSYARYFENDSEVRGLWQDALRMPRTASRLYRDRLESRLRFPSAMIADLEEAVLELGKDANLSIAVWGTADVGYTHVWILLPDAENVTRTRAQDTLNKVIEAAIGMGGQRAPGKQTHRSHATEEARLANTLHSMLAERGDPSGMYVPLQTES